MPSIKINLLLTVLPIELINSHYGGPYHIETSPLICRAMDWFLYDRDLRPERVKYFDQVTLLMTLSIFKQIG